jgi:predicted ATP-dependent endonuclease of OLD family
MPVMLKSLTLKNFKCFKKEQTFDFEKITILTGANSSGKSSVFHAILGAIQSGEFPYKFSTNGKYINMGDFTEVANNHSANEISISLKFFHNKLNDTYTYNTVWKKNKDILLPELKNMEFIGSAFKLSLKCNSKGNILNFFCDPQLDPNLSKEKQKEFTQNSVERRVVLKKLDDKKEYSKAELSRLTSYLNTLYKKAEIRNFQVKSLDTIYEEASVKKNVNLDYILDGLIQTLPREYNSRINAISSFRLHPDRTYLEQSKDRLKIDKFGEGYLDQIILWERTNPQKYKELQKITKALSLVHSLKANRSIGGGRYEVLVKTRENGTETSLFDVGFGVSQFLPIVVADLQLPDESTLFVAEPEIHLHPSVQAKFGDYLIDQVNVKNKKYILETHSEYLLNRLRLAIVKGEIKEEDIIIYYLENEGDDVKTHKLNFKRDGSIENAPEGFFETYMMDVMNIALNV